MQIYTLNVGQGQFVIVTGNSQAFIVDTYVPLSPTNDIINVKAALAKILQEKELVGLVVTGFDADHFNEVGLRIILNKYRPNWIMYPKYFKKTETADTCFSIIQGFESKKPFTRISVSLSKNDLRFYNKLSSDFKFEVFSPHADDMNSSNNCSLVCKVTENASGGTYLITGDTENDRWESIAHHFGEAISSDVLAASHHGSKNGVCADVLAIIQPKAVIISAGVNNQYGHPDADAERLFASHAENHYSTNYGQGQSLKTVVIGTIVNTYKFKT
jgi:beta-lactamase superfamily II metal-dependent hydrolase